MVAGISVEVSELIVSSVLLVGGVLLEVVSVVLVMVAAVSSLVSDVQLERARDVVPMSVRRTRRIFIEVSSFVQSCTGGSFRYHRRC